MVEHWLPHIRPQLESLAAAWSTPLGVPIAWIDVESGGRLATKPQPGPGDTSLDERGYFQLTPEESKDLSLEHERLSTDVMYSLASGFKLMDYYSRVIGRMSPAGAVGFRGGTSYFWKLVKLAHSMGQGATKIIVSDAFAAREAGSWERLSAFAIAGEVDYLARVKHSPSKWFAFIDRMFAIGEPYGIDVPVNKAPKPKPMTPNS